MADFEPSLPASGPWKQLSPLTLVLCTSNLPRGVPDLDDELRTQLHFNGSARPEQETKDPR